jgi:hypothetical protein
VISHYETLRQRIRLEIDELNQIRESVEQHWARFETSPEDKDAYLNSVALHLHNLYSGWERIFELIAVEVDGGVLGGTGWHTQLLRQMILDVPRVRPPVLKPATAEQLDEYRKFRHLVRNVYARMLDPARISPLVKALPELSETLGSELGAFLEFLGRLNKSPNPGSGPADCS